MKNMIALFGFWIALVFLGLPAAAQTPAPDVPSGRMVAELGGKSVIFPLLKTDYTADVQGDLVTVTLRQTFANPADAPIHATYLFPLPEQAAVYGMTMAAGDEVVEAQMHRTEEAAKKFAQAKKEGQAASLLTQHRPNMFTQDVANLMPGEKIDVTLRYVAALSKQDGAYELVLPLVAGPRYQPLGSGQPPSSAGEGSDRPAGDQPGPASASSTSPSTGWELETLPRYPSVQGLNSPPAIDPDRVAVQVHIQAGMPITFLESPTHAVTVDRPESGKAVVALAGGRTIDNRDFILRYRLDGQKPQAGLLAYKDQRGGFFSLLIEPPREAAAGDITPREMVFVLDCSGSMRGLPLEASRRFMKRALKNLRPGDYFRIIRFSDAATEFSRQPLEASPENVEKGLAYLGTLEGEGGTEMKTGIIQALDAPKPSRAIRLVVFLTDGYIGNEDEILGLIHRKIGPARLFAFGVGTAVNRYLLEEMGRVGRGFTRIMDPAENADEVALELASRLQSPVLTDIEVDWGALQVTDVVPKAIPDLFSGGSVRIQGRYLNPGSHAVVVRGLVNGRRAKLAMNVTLPEKSGPGGEATPLIWARAQIEDHMRALTIKSDETAKEKVVRLGLDFSLMTRWTSFVAVTRKKVNPNPGQAADTAVPLPMVEGVGPAAYGEGGGAGAPAGGSVPEPAATAGLGLMALSAWAALRRRKRRVG